jgi:hypothetical protein
MLDLGKITGKVKKDKQKKASEKVIMRGLLRDELPVDNVNVAELINTVASTTGINPSFLAANMFQEGLGNMITWNREKKKSMMDSNNLAFEETNDLGEYEDYPVEGFKYYGLDTFGSKYGDLVRKGLIDKNFGEKFTTKTVGNEKGQEVTTADFKTNKDAMTAKAAMIKDLVGEVDSYASKKGIKLDQKAKDYFVMSAYNGGLSNARKMMNELASSKVSPTEFINKGMTSLKQIHKNVMPRFEKMEMISNIIEGPRQPLFNPRPSLQEVMQLVQKKGVGKYK